MKKIIQFILNLFGLEIHKKLKYDSSQSYLFRDLMAALNNCKLRGVNPASIIDVGASEGKWTLAAMNVWENSKYLLFEPLQERKEALESLARNHSNIHYVLAGAGSKSEKINFYVSADLDGSGVTEKGSASDNREVEVRSIDEEVKRFHLNGPYVIKLDTHGYEVPILEGAKVTLSNASLVIIECYVFQVAPNSLLLGEMITYMDQLGFRMVDMIDLMWRKKDKALWQCDVFFIPKTEPCFNSSTFD